MLTTRFALPLILLLALILRLVNLETRSLWYDEAFAVLFAGQGWDAMLYGTLTPVAGGAADIHPLLYYATLNGWMALAEQSAFAVRLWSVILSVATVGLIFWLTRQLFDQPTALAAALITAVAPFHVQYSQETRMYALLGLLLVAATGCFVKGWRTRDWRWWAAFGILAALAMYTQQLAAFYLAGLGLVPLLARRRDQLIRVVLSAGFAIILYLPWLVHLPGQLGKVQSYYWLERPNIAQPLLTVRSFLVVNLDIPAPASMIAFLGALFILICLSVQIILRLRSRRTQPERQGLLLMVWLAGAPPALMWLVSQSDALPPVYLERSLLPSALMLYVALAWLFTRGGMPRPIIAVVGVIGLILVGVGLYYHYTWATFPNSPFQPAVAYIRVNWEPGDMVIHQNKLTALPMIFYDRELPQRYLRDTPGSSEDTLALPTQEALTLLADACIQTAARDGQRIWWVTFAFAEEQYAAAGRPELRRALDWLNTHYTRGAEQQFNDLTLTLYTDPGPDAWTSDCP